MGQQQMDKKRTEGEVAKTTTTTTTGKVVNTGKTKAHQTGELQKSETKTPDSSNSNLSIKNILVARGLRYGTPGYVDAYQQMKKDGQQHKKLKNSQKQAANRLANTTRHQAQSSILQTKAGSSLSSHQSRSQSQLPSSPPPALRQSCSENSLSNQSSPPSHPVRKRQWLSHSHLNKALRQPKSPPRPVLKRQPKSKSVQLKPQPKLPSPQEDVFSRLTNPKSYTGTQGKLNPKRRPHYSRGAARSSSASAPVTAAVSNPHKPAGKSKACLRQSMKTHTAVAGALNRYSRALSPPCKSPATVDP